jgi:hypothetical protein
MGIQLTAINIARRGVTLFSWLILKSESKTSESDRFPGGCHQTERAALYLGFMKVFLE